MHTSAQGRHKPADEANERRILGLDRTGLEPQGCQLGHQPGWIAVASVSRRCLQEGIDHHQVSDPAAVAEVFREEDGAAAANRRFGDQVSKPAELFAAGQLVGIKYQGVVAAHHLKANHR